MQRSLLFLFVFVLGLTATSFAQSTTPATPDFFAGKWEIAVVGTPRGDVKFQTELIRKEGKLTGDLVLADDTNGKRPITRVVENGNKLTIYFSSSQGDEISIDLEKSDENTLKGSLMSFDATAKRVK
ncbi:hypothetical protein F5984_14810 [Rudanella paleaurantiibacter]|uniref:TIGR03067 domain-containing protein n=1 Tax=Rudanella paleaurantiibacter TaxID=2614655 RepID=A0A7J5TZN3_9BACT|nr:hypothetical protein [Rudanella paleaurantiibacter]KAB7730417.1 hypothetical protein F5984_14810 [Rudanella paleaurantiibacter]